MKIAITGGIGSGKSYICSMLKEYGVGIYDCDSAAKRIMREDYKVKSRPIELIGLEAYDNGNLNKPVIASFLLASEENANKVNSIVHPAVASDFLNSGRSFMECAILFSSGFDSLVDKVICITAPEEMRAERVMRRDGISRDKALKWIACQMSQSEMALRSDYTIYNDGSSDLRSRVEKILRELNVINKNN